MKKVAVYGSLRPGNYNFDRIVKLFPGQFDLVMSTVIYGYKMFNLGYYPAIVPTGKETDKIVIDIVNCGEEPLKYIEAMEYGAGYKSVVIHVEDMECIIYYMNFSDLIPYEIIKSGDWNKFNDSLINK